VLDELLDELELEELELDELELDELELDELELDELELDELELIELIDELDGIRSTLNMRLPSPAKITLNGTPPAVLSMLSPMNVKT